MRKQKKKSRKTIHNKQKKHRLVIFVTLFVSFFDIFLNFFFFFIDSHLYRNFFFKYFQNKDKIQFYSDYKFLSENLGKILEITFFSIK